MSLSRSEQSRINGSKSKGPKTPEGKVRSSKNAFKHGLSAQTSVLDCESDEMYENHRQSWFDSLVPATETEAEIVEDIASVRWRMHRAAVMQTILTNMEVEKATGRRTGDDPNEILVKAVAKLSPEPGLIDRIARHEDRLHRRFMRNLKALALLRQLQPGDDHEPSGESPECPPVEPDTTFPQNEPSHDSLPPDPQSPAPQEAVETSPVQARVAAKGGKHDNLLCDRGQTRHPSAHGTEFHPNS